jgi:hypothetical protein
MIPSIVSALGSILGPIISGISNSGPSYKQIGSASDIQNVNPYTAQQQGQLGNLMNMFRQNAAGDYSNYGADRGNLANMINQVGSQAPYNPQASMNAFFSRTPELQSLIQGLTSPFGQSAQSAAQLASSKAIKQAMGALAGQGGIRSGAAMNEAVNAAALPQLNAVTQMQQLQSQLGGQMGNQMMGELGNQYSTGGQLQQQQNQSLLNSLMGMLQQSAGMYGTNTGMMGNIAGQQTQLAAPEWYSPQYMVTSGDNAGTMFGGALAAGTAQGSSLNNLLQQIFQQQASMQTPTSSPAATAPTNYGWGGGTSYGSQY